MSQQNENDQPQRGMVDLSQIRSVSYEDPRSDYSSTVKVSTPPKTIHHARFANYDDMPNAIPRPETTRMNTTGQIKQRPKPSSRATSFISPARRKSMARTISSLSLYGSFAGERFDASFYQSRVSLASMSEGKRNSILSQRSSIKNMKQEESSIGETEPETEHDTPKASVGKAMFMFLKAFVGSGVLFLPKA